MALSELAKQARRYLADGRVMVHRATGPDGQPAVKVAARIGAAPDPSHTSRATRVIRTADGRWECEIDPAGGCGHILAVQMITAVPSEWIERPRQGR